MATVRRSDEVLELPDDVYFEYAFRNGNSQVRADPENPARGANPWYPEVSVVTGPGYAPHPLADPAPVRTPGILHDSHHFMAGYHGVPVRRGSSLHFVYLRMAHAAGEHPE